MNSNDVVILQLLATRGIGPRTVERVLDSAKAQGEELAKFAGASTQEWVQLGLKPAQAEAVGGAREEAERLRELLEAHEIALLVKGAAGSG